MDTGGREDLKVGSCIWELGCLLRLLFAAFLEGSNDSTVEAVPSLAAQSVESPPVIHLVTDAKGNVLHEVHVQVQELPITEEKLLGQEVSATHDEGKVGNWSRDTH